MEDIVRNYGGWKKAGSLFLIVLFPQIRHKRHGGIISQIITKYVEALQLRQVGQRSHIGNAARTQIKSRQIRQAGKGAHIIKKAAIYQTSSINTIKQPAAA